MKKINNNKITTIGVLLIGISFFYYFIIAPIIVDKKLQNCLDKAESVKGIGGRIFGNNVEERYKERDLCSKLYKK